MQAPAALGPELAEDYQALLLSVVWDLLKAQQAFTTLVYVAMSGDKTAKKAVSEDACSLLVELKEIEVTVRMLADAASVELKEKV